MKQLYTRRKPNNLLILSHLLWVFLLLQPIISFSQVVVTETEEESSPQEQQEYLLSDSALALLRTYQQQYSFNFTSLVPLQTSCSNSNFSSGTYNNWIGGWGKWSPSPCPTCYYYNELDTNTVPPWPHGNYQCYSGTSVATCPPLHTLIPAPGTFDTNTGDSLKSVFPGEPYSSRLGHAVGGAHISRLKYTVYVNSSTYLFVYRYGVVLEEPMSGNTPVPHPANQQPSFSIEVQDSTGAVIDSACGYYYIFAQLNTQGQAPPGWKKHPASGKVFIWKDWTTVGMSLASYVGHHVTIVFTSKDCSQGGHCGYAYLSTYCSYLTMQTAMCQGDTSAELTAPPGFTYFWSTLNGDPSINGDTTASIVVPHPTTGSTYSCLLTALNGCQVTISQTLTYTVIHSNFTHAHACAQRSTQFTDSSYVNQNSVVNWKWDFGDATAGLVGVQNPTHTFALPGDYNVKLKSYSTEGCNDSITKVVHVDSIPIVTNSSLYKTICSRENTDITLTSNLSNSTFSWTVNSKYGTTAGFAAGSGNPISQIPTNTGKHTDTISYFITPHRGGCDGDIAKYRVAVRPLPRPVLTSKIKSICDSTLTNMGVTPYSDTTKFTWNCTASSVNLSGYSDNITTPDTLINQRLRNTGSTTDTVYYHLVAHTFACLGDTFIYKVAVYPVPDLMNSPASKTICSNTSPNITLTSHVTGTTFTWTVTPSSGNLAGSANNSIPTTLLNQTLINSGFSIENANYHIVPSAHGCNGHNWNYIVTVNPVPDLSNNPPAKQICSNTATNITLTSNVSGTLFTWTATGSSLFASGFSDNNIPTTILNQTLINSGYNLETVTYHLTPHANGCNGNSIDYIVTVYPVPDVIFTPASPSICSGQTTNIALTSDVSGTTYSWTASASSITVSGYSAGIGNSIAQTLSTPGLVVETVTYTVTPTANGCTGNTFNVIVIINPKPHLTTTPMKDTICSEQTTSVVLAASCLNAVFTWTASLATGNVTGFSNGSGNIISQPLTNTLSTLGSVKYTIHIVAGTCIGNDTNYFVYVKPKPLLANSPPNKSICNNTLTNVLLSSNVVGTLFTWTATGSSLFASGFSNNNIPTTLINQTLINSGYNIETVTYHITPHANGCNGPITDFVVTVYPTADVYYQPSSQTICDGQNTNIQVLSHVSGTTFSWTCSASSPNLAGYSNGIGNLIIQPLTNSGTTIETVTYTTTPTANNCIGNNQIVVVTVNPTPHVTTAPLAQTICTNIAILVPLTSSVPGSAFSWSCSASSPNLAGYINGTGNLISQTLSNSGYTIETITYHITPAANSCTGPVSDYIVTVNPKPDVSNNPLSSQICSATSPNISLMSNVAGTNFSWTATGSSPNIIGYGSGSGMVINQILTNLGLTIETATYHITPIANGCTGNIFDFVVSIVSVPDIYFNPSLQTICNAQTSNIQILSHVLTTTFTWTATGSSLLVTGFSNGSGDKIAQKVFNSGNIIESVTYTATPTAFGCPPGNSQNVVLTVNPKPAVTNPVRSSQICSASSTLISLQSSVSGSTFSWTCSASSLNLAGFSNGSGALIIQPLTNTGFTIETVTYIVTPTANSCSGDTSHFQVTVFPVADAYYTPPSQAICPLQTTNIAIKSHVAGASYTWTATGSRPQVSGYSAGSGDTIKQILNNTGIKIETVTYHVTPVANGCTGTASNVVVTVNPSPVISFMHCWDEVTTTNAHPIKLKGGYPYGGIYSGYGVSGGSFYPAVAGEGIFPITYEYTNTFGCIAGANQSITVNAPVSFTCGDTLIDVRDNQPYLTVQIETQCWMATNLNYGNKINAGNMQRDNCISEKYCFQDDPGNCSTKGGLYQWDEMMKFDDVIGSQGFCPPAWHIPTETEWNILFSFYTSNGFAGSPLKYTGYSGYNAYLDGTRFKNTNWNFLDFATLLWSSTSHGLLKAWAHGMNSYNPSVSFYPAARSNGFSVRCMKD